MSEQIVYGVKACMALFERRPDALQRLYFRADRGQQVMPLRAWLGEHRLPFNEVDDAELSRITDSAHHEGIAVAAEPLLLRELDPTRPLTGLWVALDAVENPYNAGAILRSAAFFGARGLLLGGVEPGTPMNRALLRVSEGGAESVPVFGVPDLATVLGGFNQRGLWVAGLETDGWPLPAEAPAAPAHILVLGNEQLGIGPAVRNACTALYRIPTRSSMGSLNVSVTAGVALAVLSQTFRALPKAPGSAADRPGPARTRGPAQRRPRAASGGLPPRGPGGKAGKGGRPGGGKPRPPGPKERKNKGAPSRHNKTRPSS